MQRYINKNTSSRGVTLVELLVAVTISAIVITMAINIYLSSKKIYKESKQKTSLDIRQLTAKKIFYDAVTNAGLSCKYGTKNQKYVNRTGENSINFDFMYDSSPVRVGDISSIGSFLENSLKGKKGSLYQPGTNYIMIKSEDTFTSLTTKPVNLNLYLNSIEQLEKNDYLALCNNDDINLVRITDVDKKHNKVGLVIAPSSEYHKGDYVGKYSIQIFYIAADNVSNNSGKLSYSLYLYTKDGSNPGVSYPVVDGVSDLKISYSILNRQHLNWRDITRNVDLDNIKAKALKISFKIKDKSFEKVILLS
ncbi:prepilin-type N-terminal cleavage/methylation domain-containing protein [Francisella sp. LA112445]|uniref:PilW family protein n=1 Tax=Francisella sp. LA112445 TaxID=1395624 RepID=UPI001788D8EC|nr:prepilin-type N-terminal cleavage/methylation domain-containing protein [Francisella sp. LA112445]QIW09447.1 prepilin-type N-terminal cleavage/methylation domain-containing protein [Francisella sp. LA112445]